MDFKLNESEEADWDLYWTDVGIQPEKMCKLWPYQRINMVPGIQNLARKNHLARNLTRMQKVFKEEFSFFPKTWILPGDGNDLKN